MKSRKVPFIVVPLLAVALLVTGHFVTASRAENAAETQGALFVTWNMEWFPSGFLEPQPPEEEAKRIEAAAQYFREQFKDGIPDIMVVQEMRDMASAEAFAKKVDSKFRPVFVSDFMYTETERSLQQLAFFAKKAPLEVGFKEWDVDPGYEFFRPPRGYAWAVFEVNGQPALFYDVHLKSNYIAEGKNVEQYTKINRIKRQKSSWQLQSRIRKDLAQGFHGTNYVMVVVAGDYNTSAQDERFAEDKTIPSLHEFGFVDAFGDIPETERPTMPESEGYPEVGYPAACFDHVLVYGDVPKPRARVMPASPISDHCPIAVFFPAVGESIRPAAEPEAEPAPAADDTTAAEPAPAA